MVEMGDRDVLISGFLRKSPPETKLKVSLWHKRFFVLHANKLLHYFKNEKEKRPVKEPINLAFCKSVESHLAHSKYKHVFSIVTEQRTYYLVADSASEMDNWVDKLCTVCGFRQTDDDNSSDLKAAQGSNEYQTSPPHSHPIAAAKLRTRSPVGSPASVSSSGSSVVSPSSPCPLSIPKHIVNDMNKARSLSDPPEPSNSPQVHYDKHRRQSEQAGLPTCPVNFQGVPHRMFSPTGVASRMDLKPMGNPAENYDTLPSPRFSSRDTYDNLPNPKRIQKVEETQENYDDVPLPRPVDCLASPSSPRAKLTVNHLSPRQEDYDAVPLPRPVSQGSSRSSQEVYDFVPPPRPTSSCSETQDLYDVPPSVRLEESENYDIVPPTRRTPSNRDTQDGGGFSDVHLGLGNTQENYDVVPLPRPTSCTQEDYDVVPPPRRTSYAQENYDVVPLPKPTSYSDSPGGQSLYNNSPFRKAQEKENYDFVPQPRPVSSCSYTEDDQGLYDFPPVGRASEQANYDVLPPVDRQRYLDPEKKENYDVVPIPRPTSQEVYDVVPPARPMRTRSESGSTPRNQSGSDPRFSDVFQSNGQSDADVYGWVPAPCQTNKDPYDTLPDTSRPVSADSGLNASFSSICSLKSDGQDDKYDAPLPQVPNEKRDSGSLSDETPDYDQDNEGIYDKPPNLASRDSIYDVPPKLGGDNILPTHSDGIYDVPPSASDDIYDVPPPQPNQGCLSNPSGNAGVPVVDRSKKPPPQVNRAMKPKAIAHDHSYYNMAPPVDRGSKHNRSNMPQPEHSYINCGSLPQRPQHLPLVKSLSGNPYVGSLPNQQNRRPAVCEDAEYCSMESAPTRSASSRCYSFGKDERQNSPVSDQCYEDMSAIQTKRLSGTKSSSSSSSSLNDNDEYTHMTPRHVGSSPIQVEKRQRRDLLYAEVEITKSPHLNKPHSAPVARKANTHYTYINEESTRALLQTSNARRENR